MSPLRFFLIGGAVLVVSGVLQVLVRPRGERESRFVNAGTVRAVVFVLLGVAAILIGAGVIPLAGVGASLPR